MTYDEVCWTMATRSKAWSKDQWNDYFSMTPELQAIEARLVKDAIFELDGPSVWTEMVKELGVLVPLVADVAGLVAGYNTLKDVL